MSSSSGRSTPYGSFAALLLVTALVLLTVVPLVGIRPASAATGGPDGYGYTWVDSNLPAPTESYAWIDGVTPGTPLGIGDDESQGPFPLGFSFTFYGVTFTDVYVCANGYVSFSMLALSCPVFPSPIPTPGVPDNAVFGMWDDLDPWALGSDDVYIWSDILSIPNRFVVTWNAVEFFGDPRAQTFEIVLIENIAGGDGDILLQYNTVDVVGRIQAIGIEDSAGTTGLPYPGSAANSLAVRFSASPAIPPDTVTFAPQDMAPLNAQQGDFVVLMAVIDASVNANDASLVAMTIDLTGTGADADILGVRLWVDDGDLTFDQFTDTNLAFGTFSGGTSTLTPLSWTITAGADERFFITYDIDPLATVGVFVGVGILDATYFTLGLPDVAVCNGCPFDTYIPGTQTEILAQTTDTLTFTPVDMAPLTVQQGDMNVLMMAVDLSVDANQATLAATIIDLTGTGVDVDIAGVTFWVDDGDLLFDPATDGMGPTSVFFGGTVIFFGGPTVFAGSDERLWITFNIDPAATIGAFVGAAMVDSTYVTASPPDTSICNGCPFDTYAPLTKTEILGPTPDILTVTPSSLAPLWATQGANDVPIMQLDLSVNTNQATLDILTIDLTGTGVDADIAAVTLWLDDGDGLFDPMAETGLDANAFTAGSLTLLANMPVTAGTPETLFVSYNIAPMATVGAFVGGLVLDDTYFSAFPPDNAVCAGCPLDTYVAGTRTQIVEPTLTVTPTSLAPGTAEINLPNVPMVNLSLVATYDTVILTDITGYLTGTGTAADIAVARLWRDDGDDAFQPAADTLLATSGLIGSAYTLTPLPSVFVDPGTPQRLFISYDIDPMATVGNFVGAGLLGAGNFTVASGAAACSGCPLDTYIPGTQTEIIAQTPSVLTATPIGGWAPAAVQQGDPDVLMAGLRIQVDTGFATLATLQLDRTGTGIDADVLPELWWDNGDGVFDTASDQLVDSQFFAGGTATFTVGRTVSSTADETAWISVDVGPVAGVGNFFGVNITDDTYLTVDPPDTAACGGCPFDTYIPAVQTEVRAFSVDTLNVTLFDSAPTSVMQGGANVLMAQANLTTTTGMVTLSSITAALTGTGTDADIGTVSVWQDDGDLTFSPAADSLKVSGTFAAGSATLPVNVVVAGGANETLFVSYNISAGAVVGNFVGVNITAPDFDVGPVDAMNCLSCPFDTYVASTKTRIIAMTGSISGTVVDGNDAPLSGVTVTLSGDAAGSTSTDANGDFSFTGLGAGSYTLEATVSGYASDSATVTLAAGEDKTGVTLRLNEITEGSISGEVRDDVTSGLLEDATVELIDANGDVADTTMTGANGRFTFTRKALGTYSVRVSAGGYVTKTVGNVEITAIQPDEDVSIRLERPAAAVEFPWWIVGLLVAVVVVILVLLLLGRRKKPAEDVAYGDYAPEAHDQSTEPAPTGPAPYYPPDYPQPGEPEPPGVSS